MAIVINGSTGISATESSSVLGNGVVEAADLAAGAAVSNIGYTPANQANVMGRNRIINGDMRIDQRNAGASVTAPNGEYTLDRWATLSSAASKFTIQQNAGSVTPPAGFSNYAGMTVTSAYSPTGGEVFGVRQRIEGYNMADFAWGTANAKTITLSFWVRSSLTGTFGGVLQNNGASRSYPFTYTIDAANTWEQKTITIAGDTSGTWLTTNGVGITVLFSIGAGSSILGTAGAWAGAAYYSATGSTNLIATNGATFYFTGVQLEVGSVATEFERRPYGLELALCQRYYQSITAMWFYGSGNGSATTASTITETSCPLFVPLRASPTLGTVNVSQMDADSYSSKSGITPTANGFNVNSQLVLNWSGLNADLQDNRPCAVRNNTVLTISAEL